MSHKNENENSHSVPINEQLIPQIKDESEANIYVDEDYIEENEETTENQSYNVDLSKKTLQDSNEETAVKGVNICKNYDNNRIFLRKKFKVLDNININMHKGKM